MKPRILYIEPEYDMAYSIRQILEEEGFDLVWLDHPGNLIEGSTAPDAECVIFGADADHIMIRHLIDWKLRWTKEIPLLIISCYCFKYQALSFLNNGVDAVLVKPFELDELPVLIRKIAKPLSL